LDTFFIFPLKIGFGDRIMGSVGVALMMARFGRIGLWIFGFPDDRNYRMHGVDVDYYTPQLSSLLNTPKFQLEKNRLSITTDHPRREVPNFTNKMIIRRVRVVLSIQQQKRQNNNNKSTTR
jgi:hypothetical protein